MVRDPNDTGIDWTHSSGELNAKHRELLELQALAQRRLKGTRANFADGMKAAKEVKRDLDWTQKRVKYVPDPRPCTVVVVPVPTYAKSDCIALLTNLAPSTLKTKTERKYPSQYKAASGRYPAPVDY